MLWVLIRIALPPRGDSNEHPQHRFLAHLSQRLIGELIGYPWSNVRPSVRPSSVRRPFTMLKDLLLQTAWPIKAKFYVEPPWVGGTIFCSRHLGHMTKMAATPIYGKNPSKIFFLTAVTGVGSIPALATCETSQVLLAGVSGGFPGVLPFRPPIDWLVSMSEIILKGTLN